MLTPNPLQAERHIDLAHPREGCVIGGKYRVDRVIGVGGMGIIVAATHLELERPVAIKVLRGELAEEESIQERFLFEARAAAQIRSEYVCEVLDVGRLDTGLPYLVMQLLRGQDLGEILEDASAIELPERIDWILQACAGLERAHALGIVHRDLKPENLFLTRRRDGSPCLKIVDFGISKQLGWRSSRPITGRFGVMGSPRYMAPEQLLAREVDERADIWSLGAVLYELATGVPAFRADSWAALCAKVVAERPLAPRRLRAEIPSRLEAVILRCLRRDREQRFQSVADLARALAPHGSELGRRVSARLSSKQRRSSARLTARRVAERVARARVLMLLAGGVALGSGLALVRARTAGDIALGSQCPRDFRPASVDALLPEPARPAAMPPLPTALVIRGELQMPLQISTPPAQRVAGAASAARRAWDIRNFGPRQ